MDDKKTRIIALLGRGINKNEKEIQILEILKKYDPVKPVNMSALHKNIPDHERGMYGCPNCENPVHINFIKIRPNYCPHCGQKLDWGK